MRGRKVAILIGGISMCASVTFAASREKADIPAGQALDPLLSCRSVTDGPARLACYDEKVAALQNSTARRDIVVVDQGQIGRVRRSLFGFATPSLDSLARKTNDHADNEINSTVRTVQRDGSGYYVVTLSDGGIWHQTGGMIAGMVDPGETVVIRRAALSSFFMRLGNRPGVKARREG